MWTLSNCLWLNVDTTVIWSQSPDYSMLTRSWISHEDWGKLAPVTSQRWWMLVIPSLIFKGDDNLQSIMFTMNVSILPALHQLPGDEMMLLEHGALSLLSAQSHKKISMLVFRNMLELLLECCQCPGLMGQHNRYILMHVCTQQSHQLNTEPNIQGSGHPED